MALNSLYCADVPLSNYSLTHSLILSSNKVQSGDIRVPANPGPPGKWTLERRVVAFIGGEDMTGALHVLQTAVVTTAFHHPYLQQIKEWRVETFWYRLMQVQLENGR